MYHAGGLHQDMVTNTQKSNMAKVKQLLQANLKRVQSSRQEIRLTIT
jgi:CRISPR/Cas system-associated endoribonuclease Cas2